jgi:hypothetical protein
VLFWGFDLDNNLGFKWVLVVFIILGVMVMKMEFDLSFVEIEEI